MNLALTSDFPSTANRELVARIRAVARSPRIGWLAPAGRTARLHFLWANVAFRKCGIAGLERVALRDDPAGVPADLLGRYDIVYLSGGNPIAFRRDLRRSRLDAALRCFAETGRPIVAASGGAMQLTRNVSLFRLLSNDVETVVSERVRFDAIGLAGCEILPHLNRHDAAFLEKVRQYSERVSHDIVALADGAVAFFDNDGDCRCVGEGARYHQGIRRDFH